MNETLEMSIMAVVATALAVIWPPILLLYLGAFVVLITGR